jgi:hypothetical protein
MTAVTIFQPRILLLSAWTAGRDSKHRLVTDRHSDVAEMAMQHLAVPPTWLGRGDAADVLHHRLGDSGSWKGPWCGTNPAPRSQLTNSDLEVREREREITNDGERSPRADSGFELEALDGVPSGQVVGDFVGTPANVVAPPRGGVGNQSEWLGITIWRTMG